VAQGSINLGLHACADSFAIVGCAAVACALNQLTWSAPRALLHNVRGFVGQQLYVFGTLVSAEPDVILMSESFGV
jgi:hypothetical protein